jgi:hypothetical protein
MRWFLESRVRPAAAAFLIGVWFSSTMRAQSAPQTPTNNGPVATVTAIHSLPEKGGLALEIVSTRSLTPVITRQTNPPTLVIDLPNTQLGKNAKRVDVHTGHVQGMRFSQLHQNPPAARIVVNLVKPANYSSEATGNLLLIWIDSGEANPRPTTIQAHTAQPPAAPVNLPSGDAALDGNRIESGSSVTAGSDAAVVQLGRGGQVRVCPGTTVSVTPSKNGRSLMLGMNTGALEAHYTLGPVADSIMTPDFRIQLVGPGEFDYAINADSKGNTCVQALAGNTASVIVSELMGDGTYQIKPEDHVVFHTGQLKNVALVGDGNCGCPAPSRPVTLASSSISANQPSAAKSAPAPNPSAAPETASLPPSNPKEVHYQVDAPFVFRGDDLTPPPIVAVGILPLRSTTQAEPVASTVLPPAQEEHRGFFRRIRGFFAAIFR